MIVHVTLNIDVPGNDHSTAERVAETTFDLVCSVGDNADACARFDLFVRSVDGYEWAVTPS